MRKQIVILWAIVPTMMVSSMGCSLMEQRGQDGQARSLFAARDANNTRDIMMDETLDPMGTRSINRMLSDDLSPSQIATTWKSRTFKGRDPEKAKQLLAEGQQKYSQAVDQMKSDPQGQSHIETFTDAANLFRLASSRLTESHVEEESLFYEGESYFYANRYVQANRAFEKLIVLYSGSKYLDKAEARRMSIATYWLELARTDPKIKFNDPKRPRSGLAAEARRILHRIRIDDPTGKLADDATFALGSAYFENEDYYEAATTFEDLRRNYPGSTHQYKAHLLELKARMMSYAGPDYDDEPLKKADELMRAIVQRFPDQARDEEEFLAKEAGKIQNMLAARDISMAEYFENRGEYGAAKIYYEKVAQKYPDTEFRAAIQEQIASIADKPAVPEQKAQWLIDWLGRPERQKAVIAAGDNETFLK